jgi:hypothetical protein|tara:strand:+ start:1145 stop:1483 length:339 start_codon:yes stop_codon:yes gene_type:complete
MRPKQPKKAYHDDLFKARLDQIINMKHELVILADRIDWAWLDEQIAPYFSDEERPAERSWLAHRPPHSPSHPGFRNWRQRCCHHWPWLRISPPAATIRPTIFARESAPAVLG